MDLTKASPEIIETYLSSVNSKDRYKEYVKSIVPTDYRDIEAAVRIMNAVYVCKEGL